MYRLSKRSSTYYFNAHIPVDLLLHFDSSKISKSLKTSDKHEALRLAAIMNADLEQKFAKLRTGLAPSVDKAHCSVPLLTREDVTAICGRWETAMLEVDDREREGGFEYGEIGETFEERIDRLSEYEQAIRHALGRGQKDFSASALQDWLRLNKIDITESDPLYPGLQIEFLKFAARAAGKQLERAQGVEHVTPIAPIIQRSKISSSHHLSDLLDKWKAIDDTRPVGTILDYEQAAKSLTAFLHNKPATQIMTENIEDWLGSLNLHYRTLEKKLGIIRTLYNTGITARMLKENPAHGIKIKKPSRVTEAPRTPYSHEELNVIFSSPIYTQGFRMEGGGGEAAAWLPLLALLTGARLEELAQLRVEDIKNHPEHGPYLSITVAAGRIKNEGSIRDVPIHSELIRAGFLREVERLKAAGQVRVFPLVDSKGKKGVLSAAWSKWWGRWNDKLGITDSHKVFHGFRHGFVDACTEAEIQEVVRFSITGHVGKMDDGRKYGTGIPLGIKLKAVRKVRYPGVVIPVVLPE